MCVFVLAGTSSAISDPVPTPCNVPSLQVVRISSFPASRRSHRSRDGVGSSVCGRIRAPRPAIARRGHSSPGSWAPWASTSGRCHRRHAGGSRTRSVSSWSRAAPPSSRAIAMHDRPAEQSSRTRSVAS